jgi:hypothetical protein
MATTVKRLSIISLVGVTLALIICGSGAPARPSVAQTPAATSAETQAANLPPVRPVIRAEVNGTTVGGLPGSYCWPQPDTSAQCDFVDDPQPSEPIDAAEGTSLKFLVEPASPAPVGWRAILLDDKGQDGNPRQTDLTDSTFMVEGLNAGSHRLVAEALYTGDTAENQPFVDYVFLLQVGEKVAMATPVATTGATPEVVASPLAPTSVPTEMTETVEATLATTPESPATEAPTVESGQPVSTAEVLPTIIPSPTVELLPTEAPTATLVPPTMPPVATEQPTAIPIATTSVPVTATSVAASTAPEQAIIVAGRSYDPIAVNACVLGPDGGQTCTSRPYNAAAERVLAAPGDTAQVVFKGPRPTAITVSILSADGIGLINKQSLPPDNLALYILQQLPGNFVLSVEIVWPQGKATYFYRLTIGS